MMLQTDIKNFYAAAKRHGDLITVENVGEQHSASLNMNLGLRLEVWGSQTPPTLKSVIEAGVAAGRYDACLSLYSDAQLAYLEEQLKHDRDLDYSYAALIWWFDKYLIQDRATGSRYETPQFAIMLTAMALYSGIGAFNEEVPDSELVHVVELYEAVSTKVLSQPTPIRAGLRTPLRQFASCVLAEMDDTLPSIMHTNLALTTYGAARAGLGLNVSPIRGVGSPVSGGEVVSTGVIPFLKMTEASIKSTSQHGLRSASATVFFPFWHAEVESLVIAKSSQRGSHDRKVFNLDYCMVVHPLFYKRYKNGQMITLFSPDEVPTLLADWGTPNFEETYERMEERTDLRFKKRVPASELMNLALEITVETGRLYWMNIENANAHNPFLDTVQMSNLCMEVIQPTIPIQHIDGNGRIGICILGAIAATEITPDNIAQIARVAVRQLDTLIDYQTYPVKAGEQFCKYWRSLGVGLTNLACWLASNGLTYDHPDAPNAVSDLQEMVQWHLLNASCDLAIERGPAPGFQRTRYALGQMPIDHYKKSLDTVVTTPPKMDWDSLRQKILKHGLRNCTLTAQMPCESSSIVQDTTNGIDPVRGVVSYKKAKAGPVKWIAPTPKGPKAVPYQGAFHMNGNTGFLNIVLALQKWMCMSISANLYYDYSRFPDERLPLDVILNEHRRFWSLGGKTLYYIVTNDGDDQSINHAEKDMGCASGACTL